MRLADHARAARRILAYVALVAVAGTCTVLLSQCRLVDERLTGVAEPFKNETGLCFNACNDVANAAIRVESQRHVSAVKACSGDATCLALEEALHESNVAAIQLQREQCKANCHHQGSGFGGR